MFRVISICAVFMIFKVHLLLADEKQNHMVIEDLHYDWQIINSDDNKMYPLADESSSYNHLILFIDLAKYSDYSLRLKLPPQHFLYINEKMVFGKVDKSMLLMKIDSLREKYNSSEIRLDVYSEEIQLGKISAQIIQPFIDKTATEGLSILPIRRQGIENNDYFILSTLLIFGLLVIYRYSYSKIFNAYFSVFGWLRFKQAYESTGSNTIFSTTSMSFIFLYSYLCASSFVNLTFQTEFITFETIGLSSNNNIISNSVIVFLLIFGLMFLKGIAIKLVSRLFYLHKFSELYFFTYFRFALLLSISVFIVAVLNGVSHGYLASTYENVIIFMAVTLLILRVALIFISLNSFYSFRKLHLFSYLCSTEIIPLTIFITYLKG